MARRVPSSLGIRNARGPFGPLASGLARGPCRQAARSLDRLAVSEIGRGVPALLSFFILPSPAGKPKARRETEGPR